MTPTRRTVDSVDDEETLSRRVRRKIEAEKPKQPKKTKGKKANPKAKPSTRNTVESRSVAPRPDAPRPDAPRPDRRRQLKELALKVGGTDRHLLNDLLQRSRSTPSGKATQQEEDSENEREEAESEEVNEDGTRTLNYEDEEELDEDSDAGVPNPVEDHRLGESDYEQDISINRLTVTSFPADVAQHGTSGSRQEEGTEDAHLTLTTDVEVVAPRGDPPNLSAEMHRTNLGGGDRRIFLSQHYAKYERRDYLRCEINRSNDALRRKSQ